MQLAQSGITPGDQGALTIILVVGILFAGFGARRVYKSSFRTGYLLVLFGLFIITVDAAMYYGPGPVIDWFGSVIHNVIEGFKSLKKG